LREEVLDVDRDLRHVQSDSIAMRDEESVRLEAAVGVEDTSNGAERDREPVSGAPRVAFRPEMFDEHLSGREAASPRDENFEQVARPLRLPFGSGYRLSVARDAKAAERRDRQWRGAVRPKGHQQPGRARRRSSHTEPVQRSARALGGGPSAWARQSRDRELSNSRAEHVAEVAPRCQRLFEQRELPFAA
jgi:hypothetical protein